MTIEKAIEIPGESKEGGKMRNREELLKYIRSKTPNKVYVAVGGDIVIEGRIPNELLKELRHEGKLGRLHEDAGFFLRRDEWKQVVHF